MYFILKCAYSALKSETSRHHTYIHGFTKKIRSVPYSLPDRIKYFVKADLARNMGHPVHEFKIHIYTNKYIDINKDIVG